MNKRPETPGPWHVGHKVPFMICAGERGNGPIVAECCAMEEITREQRDANARLMAQAPAMLAALRRAVPWLGRLIADGGHLRTVAPNDAIGALAEAESILATLGAQK